METLNKKQIRVFGHKYWLLGEDVDGIRYWMQEPEWQCDWYWGGLYIETFTNNRQPARSVDISSHQHFDSLFMKGPECSKTEFKKFFKKTTLSDNEIWELVDYIKTFYTLKSVAELFKHGYSWQTEKAKIDDLQNQEQYDLVNKVWLPEVFKRIEKIFEE